MKRDANHESLRGWGGGTGRQVARDGAVEFRFSGIWRDRLRGARDDASLWRGDGQGAAFRRIPGGAPVTWATTGGVDGDARAWAEGGASVEQIAARRAPK